MFLTQGPLSITSSVTVDGGGRIGVDGRFASGRVITVSSGGVGKPEVALKRLTVTGGASTTGGGIRVGSAALTLDSVRVLSNFATFNGGGLDIGGGAEVVIRNSSIASNGADRFGGGIYVEGGT